MDFEQTQRIELDFSDEESVHPELTAFKRILGYLSVENEGAPATDFPLYEGVNIIGRVKESNVCIEKKALSKRHAVIQIESDTSGFIFDLGSVNKTRKGKTVLKSNVCYNLENNDILWFGNVKSHFKFFKTNDDDDETSEEETPDLTTPSRPSNSKPSKPLIERRIPAEVESLPELQLKVSGENEEKQLKKRSCKNVNSTIPTDSDSDELCSQSILEPTEIPNYVKNISSNEQTASAQLPPQQKCLPGVSEENMKSLANFNLDIDDSDETGSENNFPIKGTVPNTSSKNNTSKILGGDAIAKSDPLFEDSSSKSSDDLLAELIECKVSKTNKVLQPLMSPTKAPKLSNFKSIAVTNTKDKTQSFKSCPNEVMLKPCFSDSSSNSSDATQVDINESHQNTTKFPENRLTSPSNLESSNCSSKRVLRTILHQRPKDNEKNSSATAVVEHVLIKKNKCFVETQRVDLFAETQPVINPFAETQVVMDHFAETQAVDLMSATQPVDLMAETPPIDLMAETPPIDLMAETQPIDLMAETRPVDIMAETRPVDIMVETQAINDPFKSRIISSKVVPDGNIEDSSENETEIIGLNSEGGKPVNPHSDVQKPELKINSDVEIDQLTQPIISYEDFEDSGSFTATPNYKSYKLVNMAMITSKSGSSVEEKSLLDGDQRTSTFLMPQNPCPSKLFSPNESEILCPESQPVWNRTLNVSSVSAVSCVEDSYLEKKAEKSPALFTDKLFLLNSHKEIDTPKRISNKIKDEQDRVHAKVNISKISPLKRIRDLLESDDDELPDISPTLSIEKTNEPSTSFKIPGIKKLSMSFTQEAEDDFLDIAKIAENKVGKPYDQKIFPARDTRKRNPRAKKTPKRYINDSDEDEDSKSQTSDNNSIIKKKNKDLKMQSGELGKEKVSIRKNKSKSKPDKELNQSLTLETFEKKMKKPKTKVKKKNGKNVMSDAGSDTDELTDSGINVFAKATDESLASNLESKTVSSLNKNKSKKAIKQTKLSDSDVSSTSKKKSAFLKITSKQNTDLKLADSEISKSVVEDTPKVRKVKKSLHLKLKDTNTDTDNDQSDNTTTIKGKKPKKNTVTISTIESEELTLKENYPETPAPAKEVKKTKLPRNKKNDNSVFTSDSTTSTSNQFEKAQSNKNVKNGLEQLASKVSEFEVLVKSGKSKKLKVKSLDESEKETVPETEVEIKETNEKKTKKRGRPKKGPKLTTSIKEEIQEHHVDSFELKSELTLPITPSNFKEPTKKNLKRNNKNLVSKIEFNEEKAITLNSPSQMVKDKDRVTPSKLDNTLQVQNTFSKTDHTISSVEATPTKQKKNTSSKIRNATSVAKSKKSPLHQDSTLSSTSDTVSNIKLELNRKRSSSPDYSEVVDCSSEKKAKESAFNVMFTGFTDRKFEKIIESLGGTITTDMHSCTHLVTDQFRRTCKLLCAVAKGLPVIDSKWIEVAKKEKTLLNFEKYILKDKVAENKYQFKMLDTLKKAAKSPLLKGWNVHVTSNVLPSPDQMKDIIEAGGAKFLPKMPRGKGRKNLVISCEKDETMIQFAKKNNIPVVSADFLLNGLLEYKIDLACHELNLSNKSNS